MKITLIGPVYPYRGGIAHFTTLLAKKLIEVGNDVQVISFKKQYPNILFPGKSDKDNSPGREKVAASYLLKPLNPISWVRTVNVVTAFHPNQIIVPWWVTFWGPAFQQIITRLKRKGFKTTILIHNTIPHEAHFFDRFLAKQTLKTADSYIVMTKNEEFRLKSIISDKDKNINVIPHPIYNQFSPSQKSKTELRSVLDLPENKPIILFFGFVRPYKGLNDLIEAVNILYSRGKEIHLVIAGEFWGNREVYDNQIKTQKLEKIIHIHDHYIPDKEVAKFFQAADLFVAPYREGTQSGALKIALGFGLPIVATNIIIDPLIKDLGKQCKIVPPNDPEALSEAILQQLQRSKLDNKTIKMQADQSWNQMVNIISNC
ncbi:MAG TPA: hypothetical protein DCK95_11750 [Anaerolineaceae bacterium]|nr:hypothetical protein [Anaerolineaceae bacterium]